MARSPSPSPRSRRSAGAPPLGRTVADLRALAHPLRLRMMELFAESAKTTKQVAELLDQPPTRLYHHVAALERAGLLVLTEKRQNRGAVEKWYTGVARQIQGSVRRKGGDGGRAARRAVAATVLEQARQELLAIPPGSKQVAALTRLVVVARPAEIPTMRQWLFDAVHAFRAEFQLDDPGGANEAECERWALTLAFAPVRPPARRRKTRS